MSKVGTDIEQFLDSGQKLGTGQETVVEAGVQEVSVLGQNLVDGQTVGDARHETAPGGLDDLDTHVVGQVLDQVQHFLSQSKGRMVNFKLVHWQKLCLLV